MNILARKIKLMMEVEGVSQVELAGKAEVHQGNLSQMLKGTRDLDDEKAEQLLVQGFNMRPSEARKLIAEWRIEDYAKDAPELASKLTDDEELAGYARIPILGDLACGDPTEIASMQDPEPVDHALIGEEFVDGNLDRTFAFWAKGNSMAPEIKDGSLLVIEAGNEYRGPSVVYAFRFGNEYGLGRIVKSDDAFVISKANTDWPNIPINSDFEICGFLKTTIRKG